jgi:hypothetical protein
MRIGIVAPSTPILPDDAEAVRAIAALGYPEVELVFDPQCFVSHGHFAGADAVRREALVAMANRPDIDAIWFARGGYGACRIAGHAVAAMGEGARTRAIFSPASIARGSTMSRTARWSPMSAARTARRRWRVRSTGWSRAIPPHASRASPTVRAMPPST